MQLNTLQDVLVEQLADLYSAEKQLVQALPKMEGAAHSDELRTAIREHFGQTQEHVKRLDKAMQMIPAATSNETCEAMQGLIAEGEEVIQSQGDPAALDAALIAAAQRVEHYEIAAYGTARALAGELGYDDMASLLGKTLDEESHADSTLTKIAQGGFMSSGINQEAAAR